MTTHPTPRTKADLNWFVNNPVSHEALIRRLDPFKGGLFVPVIRSNHTQQEEIA